jgi:hypothetical protein
MRCQKCLKDVQEAKLYTFYYGNQTGKVRRGRQIITNYQISGSHQLSLCNDCVFAYAMDRRAIAYRGWGIFFVLVACVPAIIALISDDSILAELLWLAAAFGLTFAISLVLMGEVEKKRVENHDFASLPEATQADKGSRLAIALRTSDLHARGYQEFFTPNRMKQLQMKTPITVNRPGW